MVFSKIHELIHFQQDRYPSKDAFNQKILGRWETRSTEHFIESMNDLSNGLLLSGILKGDKIGIFTSHSSTEWLIIDMACLQIGLITVPINVNYSDDELAFIINEINFKYCFVNEDLLADRLRRLQVPDSQILSFGNSIRFKSWSDIKVKANSEDQQNISQVASLIDDTDLATIIYTSGSTGMPKGVMLSHKNIVSNIKAIISLVPVNYQHRVASYLPLSHIFERMVLYTYVSIGAHIYFIQNPKEIIKAIQDIKPHYISSVPRVLEKVHNEIYVRVKKSNPISKLIVGMALRAGEQESTNMFGTMLQFIKLQLADLFVYRRWRNILGGQIKGIIVGAASMQEHIARLYSRAGIPVKEGYGLTETSPVVSFNRFEAGGTKFGTVGIPIPGVEVRIVHQDEQGSGEIIVRGPNVMMGYYNNPNLTAERIDQDGWFSTGDIGKFIDGRFLVITDRKKNIYKTSSGQYIYPQKIENHLRTHEAIDQCMTIGFQKPYVAAFLIPDFKFLKSWCKQHGIHWTSELYMVENDRVKKYYQEVIDELNSDLKNYEKIKRFKLLYEEWSIDTGEYTPTLKLKRQKIISKYQKEMESLFL